MWEKNFWKIYSVSRCSSDIEHKPNIPNNKRLASFVLSYKVCKKQVLFIDLGFLSEYDRQQTLQEDI